MNKFYLLLTLMLLRTTLSYAQTCDCASNWEWVKQTFEQNDAGFQYVIQNKGEQAYAEHNKRINEQVKTARTLDECTPILFEWLRFFRSNHFGIRVLQQKKTSDTPAETVNSWSDWQIEPIEAEAFKKYLDGKKDHDYEGIWQTGLYTIGIRQKEHQYVGSIIESATPAWTKGQVKLTIRVEQDKAESVFYMQDHSAVTSDRVELTGKNHLQIGNFQLTRQYPPIEDEPQYTRYFKMLSAKRPYLEQLNERTLYLRIPSFQQAQKPAIDSLVALNRDKILKTENLIIDIRNGTGGSDGSYKELIPILYTNPIRIVGVEMLSTKLNNQRMLDFINKPEYGMSEEDKTWARESYEKLENNLGKFVNLTGNVVRTLTYDTVYTYPKNVGIIINQQNGSTDEQFLLAAKQSKKVKLFGTTTMGVLDISNMYFVPSPCKEFELGYSLSKSRRIPEFTIDGKGLQPDYYLDKSIPLHEWTSFVSEVLNAR